jgi:hypothetical protein
MPEGVSLLPGKRYIHGEPGRPEPSGHATTQATADQPDRH